MSVFLLEKGLDPLLVSNHEGFSAFQWTPSGSDEDFSIGYLPSSSGLFFSPDGICNSIVRIERKIPPRSLVTEIVRKEVARVRSTGRVVSREETSIIRADETKKLIPRTLPSYTDIGFSIVLSESDGFDYLLVDRSQGLDVELCLTLLKDSGVIPVSCKAMFPSKFYGNLIEHLLDGSSNFGCFSIGESIEIFSEERGIYEVHRGTSTLTLKENESVSSVSLKNGEAEFSLKRDGLIKNISFNRKNPERNEQIKIMVKIIEAILNGD